MFLDAIVLGRVYEERSHWLNDYLSVLIEASIVTSGFISTSEVKKGYIYRHRDQALYFAQSTETILNQQPRHIMNDLGGGGGGVNENK